MDARRLRWIVRCYPGAWRARYGGELLAVLEQHTVTPRTVRDLLWHLLRARLDPTYWSTPGLAPAQQSQAAITSVYASFPLFLLSFWALAGGNDSPHDNALTDPLPGTDALLRLAWVSVMGGLALAFVALLVGALMLCVPPLQRALLARGLRLVGLALVGVPMAAVALLWLLLRFTPSVAFVLLVLLFVPGVAAVVGMPLVPLKLSAGAGGDEAASTSNDVRRPASASRALLGVFSGLLALTVLGALLRDGQLSGVRLAWHCALYAVTVALPAALFALVATRPLAPPPTSAETERVTQMALIPISVAALGLSATVAGMLLTIARTWSLPLDGRHWRAGEVAECVALVGFAGAMLLAVVRAVAVAATARAIDGLGP